MTNRRAENGGEPIPIGNFVIDAIMMEKVASSRNHAQFETKMTKIAGLFQAKMSFKKTISFGAGRAYIVDT